MQAADALRTIAYLLEAEGAETYKVQAFRRAAATVDDVPPEELARLAEEGRLETLASVGKSTAAVISEVLSGTVPGYLAALRERAPRLYLAVPPATSWRPCGAIVIAIRTGPTAGARSRRWRDRRWNSATSTSSSLTTALASLWPTGSARMNCGAKSTSWLM